MQNPLLKIRLIDLPVSSKYHDLVSWVSWNFSIAVLPNTTISYHAIWAYTRRALVKARRPYGVLKACWYTPIYTLMASQHAWPRDGRGCFHNPTSYLVEMWISCNFFSDLRGRGLGLWPPTNRGLPPNISYFYAMLSVHGQDVPSSFVCVSVCYTPVLYQNG